MLKFTKYLKKIGLFTCLLLSVQELSAQQKAVDYKIKTIKYSKFISEVEKAPDSLKYHEAFIQSIDINDPFLNYQYLQWVKKFPTSATVPFAIGKAFYRNSIEKSKMYLLKAVAVNPNISEAWMLLSQDANLKGEKQDAQKYMDKAVHLDSLNANYAIFNADLYERSDTAKYNDLMANIAIRFSGKKELAQAYYWLASSNNDSSRKKYYYKQLHDSYLSNQNDWFRAGMIEYYDMLINQNRYDEVKQLALDMANKIKINRTAWKQRLIVSDLLVNARNSLDSDKIENARLVLKKVDLGRPNIYEGYIDAQETLTLFKAEIEDRGNNTLDAYDSLKMYYAKYPSDNVYKRLTAYALKLGNDSTKIAADITKIRNEYAWPVTNFTLQNYIDKKQISLSSFRGKVVLLTYWFPSCGPCKAEFPYFESVLKKFKKEDIVYLAINLGNHEEEYIKPIIDSNRFTFTALRDAPDRKIGNLPYVIAAPTNFLFDKNGRVIFSNFRIKNGSERRLELMISELLTLELANLSQ
jgi:thiol-disulfide isomerase/thioredoxin